MDDSDTKMEDMSGRRRGDSRDLSPRDRERSPDRREPERRRSRSRDRDYHRRRSPSRSRSPPRQHRPRSRSYSRDRRYRSYRSPSRSPRYRRDDRPHHRRPSPPRSKGGPMNAPAEEAEAHAKASVRENRVYCGNLTYSTTYTDLTDYMKEVGDVIFAEIFVTPAGQSKGCGIVEFADRASAERAIKELGERSLLGRPVFIREDRENEARFGAVPVPGKIGAAFGEARPAGRPVGVGFGASSGPPVEYRQLFVGNLPYTATWQDMKDLFREAGSIIRADVAMFPDGRPKGTGIVVFESHEDAKNAVATFNGYTWQESILQVRPDRFAGSSSIRGGRGGFAPRGMARGGFAGRGGFGGGFAGGFVGGFGGPAMGRGGRNFTNDLYADYNGPEGATESGTPAVGALPFAALEPSKQIMIRNLPWSTSNEDLVELFETTGQVVLAEILFDGTRSKGSGVVQFKEVEEAEQACQKFTGYVYGGRPLDVQFNDRWHRFSDTAAQGTTGAVA